MLIGAHWETSASYARQEQERVKAANQSHHSRPCTPPPPNTAISHSLPPPDFFLLFFSSLPVGMARLNTHLSATPQPRASTVDSLYRDPSVAPQSERNGRTSSYSVISPTRSMQSDKENEVPDTYKNTPRRGKAKGLRSASARMPTPDSGSTEGHGSKRRRTGNYDMSRSQRYDGEHEADEEDGIDTPSQSHLQPEPDEEGDLRFYNPNQDPEKRRRLRATMRDHQRMLDGMFSNIMQAM